jgi:capsid protein
MSPGLFHGPAQFIAARQASMMFLCWLEEAIVRRRQPAIPRPLQFPGGQDKLGELRLDRLRQDGD